MSVYSAENKLLFVCKERTLMNIYSGDENDKILKGHFGVSFSLSYESDINQDFFNAHVHPDLFAVLAIAIKNNAMFGSRFTPYFSQYISNT